MEKTVDFEKQAIAGGAALIFDGNRSIKRLCAKVFCPVEIRYAQNAVTDTLISAGTFTPDENGALCAEFATPLTASGLYLFAAGALEDVAVFANEGVNLENLYPKAFDIPLAENMLLDTVSVFTSRAGFSQYSLYTSMNGRDFSLVAVKDDEKPCGENGDTFALDGREARVIRVFFEYHSASPEAAFEKLTFTGAPSGTAPVPCPPIDIPNFADTVYAAPVTEEETLCEVAGIVERRLGAPYASWFRFVLGEKSNMTGSRSRQRTEKWKFPETTVFPLRWVSITISNIAATSTCRRWATACACPRTRSSPKNRSTAKRRRGCAMPITSAHFLIQTPFSAKGNGATSWIFWR